jgi:N-acetylglutamate synthase-like GNAT family acetyltransferase
MNAALVPSSTVASPPRRRPQAARPSAAVTYRSGAPSDAQALHDLIQANLEEGHLLPRPLDELSAHAQRFVVARRRGRVVGCAELAPLGARVAEVRSLVVDRSARAHGIGRALLTELQRRARLAGFETLCAFTHDAGYFVRRGYSIVPHAWVPEKIALDCQGCPKFRRCGQHAVVLPLGERNEQPHGSFVPLASLRG